MKIRQISLLPKNKKAMGIGDLYPVILTIAVVALLIAIVMMILTQWVDITNDKTGGTTSETSSKVSNITANVDTVANATTCGFNSFAITTVANLTNGSAVNSAFYEVVSPDQGTWWLTSAGAGTFMNDTTWLVNYTFNYGGQDCEAIESIIDDYTNFIPWIGIILLVVAAAIVLGVVISSFAGDKKGRI